MQPPDPPDTPHGDPRLARVRRVYEALSPESLADLEALFAPQGRFVDPFNDVVGRPAIRQVFAHMFTTLRQPRFVILEAMSQGDAALLLWELHFQGEGGMRRIEGMSRLRFDAHGNVSLHQDHWDPARQLYEDVPVLGALMRWLRRRLAAPAGS